MKTILLIENSFDIRENLVEAFEMEGYKVLAAENGDTGVEYANTFIPDLILSEILIGKKDGYEVLRLLLDSYRTCRIPLIFCTTKSEKRDKILALTLGADDYIVKPFDFDSLFLMAKMWIESGTKRFLLN